MKIPQDGYLLRVFLGESDKWHGRPLYEAIVMKARELPILSKERVGNSLTGLVMAVPWRCGGPAT